MASLQYEFFCVSLGFLRDKNAFHTVYIHKASPQCDTFGVSLGVLLN